MPKRSAKAKDAPRLFEEYEKAHDRRVRRQRALFIPHLLREAGQNQQLAGLAQDKAYATAVHWANLETDGELAKHKETSIDTQFLDQLFGEGLGYRLKTASPTAWELEHKMTVPGVGTADAALGEFPAARSPTVVVELKDAQTDLDRDKSNGRTAVQQCWDYLNALPECAWGIVSNFATVRLYHRAKGILTYEEFTLQELRSRERFNEFYAVFGRDGLLPSKFAPVSRAAELLARTEHRQRVVGDELYREYEWNRLDLIEHLYRDLNKPFDESIRIAQKLLDRIIFIAFCEDRGLLPEKTLEETRKEVRTYSRARNPAWESFLDLFAAIDEGARGKREITAYNGGLFRRDPAIDALDLEDEKWTNAFVGYGRYDFSEEVNVDVLGHLFERSITQLEKLRVGGLFALKANVEDVAEGKRTTRPKPPRRPASDANGESVLSKMPKSAQRKRFGIYYTPPAFTGLIVERTVDEVVKERFAALARTHRVDPESRGPQNSTRLLAYWVDCLESLKTVTVCDPACGSGAFLIRAYEALDAQYKIVAHGLGGARYDPAKLRLIEETVPDLILRHNLYGVDLSKEGVEITQLALWIRSARKGKSLADLSRHIVHGNSLVSDPSVDPHALDWQAAFPHIFGPSGPGGFSCVIGNPPWERVKVQDREFFSLTDPETAGAVSAATRKKRIEAMPAVNPELHKSYLVARDQAQKTLDYARQSGRYPLTGKGDINLYMLFAELAGSLVACDGFVGLLVPSGIATDDTTKGFFNGLMEGNRLVSLYDFENRNKVFEDVDGRFKFSAIAFRGGKPHDKPADFVFFAHGVEDTAEVNKHRHIPLAAADMALLNPNTKTCPIFRTRRDAELTKAIYKRVPILIDETRKEGGNPWEVNFLRMFDQTNDAEHFEPRDYWEKAGYALDGNVYVQGKKRGLPLYEAKMIQAYDHRAASVLVEEENWVRQGQKAETTLVQHQNPEFCAQPRWWVDEATVAAAGNRKRDWLLAYKDITSATNERTMIASFLPWVAAVNSAPLVLPGGHVGPRLEACLLANLNAVVLDYVARQKVGSVHLNYFIVQQLPVLPPDTYADKCPWSERETLEQWVSDRVLKLSCTANDMKPLAAATKFDGSAGGGVQKWRDAERVQLRAELDAAFAVLYGLSEDEFAYVLTTFPSVAEPVIIATRNAFRDLSADITYAR